MRSKADDTIFNDPALVRAVGKFGLDELSVALD
jgi:hypothetical protein